MNWHLVLPGVWLFRDSCNVYAVEGKEGSCSSMPGPAHGSPISTNCRSDRWRCSAPTTFGTIRRAQSRRRPSIPVYVPEGEQAIFADPEQHFRERETYIIYDNLWDLFAPIEGVPVAGVLRDYERYDARRASRSR